MTPEAALSEVSNELQLLCKQTHIPTHAQTHRHQGDEGNYRTLEQHEGTEICVELQQKRNARLGIGVYWFAQV